MWGILEEGQTAKLKIVEAIAEQIWREQQLTSARMTWNLTFQGFLIAAFVLTLSSGPLPIFKLGFELLIGLAGGIVAWATRSSIVASQHQRDYLKEMWNTLPDHLGYPRPFSEHRSGKGRHAAKVITFTVMVMWIGLVIIAALANMNTIRQIF